MCGWSIGSSHPQKRSPKPHRRRSTGVRLGAECAPLAQQLTVRAGLGLCVLRAACFVFSHRSPKGFFKLHWRLVKYDSHLIDCPPARFAEMKYFYLPTTNISFKEQPHLFHLSLKLWWAQSSNIVSFVFWNKIWQVLKHTKCSNLMFRDFYVPQNRSKILQQ